MLFDGGDSLSKHAKGKKRAPLGQRRTKARLIAEDWVDAGVDVAALGSIDWELGTAFVTELVGSTSYPVVAANLVCEGGKRPYPAATVVERSGHKIGFVGLTSGVVDGCAVTDPVEAANEARALLGEVDATVLLWPARDESAYRAALRGLPFDFVLDTAGRGGKRVVPQRGGDSWMLGGGVKTKSLGITTLSFGNDGGFVPEGFDKHLDGQITKIEKQVGTAEARMAESNDEQGKAVWQRKIRAYDKQIADLRAQREAVATGGSNRLVNDAVSLTKDVADHVETAKRVNAAKSSISNLADATPSEIISRPLKIAKGGYAGADVCIECHKAEYVQWRKTGHSRALPVLVSANRHHDADCYSCHVTGAEPAKSAGFDVIVNTPDEIGGAGNVQCESCHGPSAAHAAAPDTAPKPVKTPTEAGCRGCHTPEQDEGRFDFGTYLPKVQHGQP